MNENETFRQNLTRFRIERGLNAKELSIAAGMGERGVKDIEEGRSQSPKISTVFALAKALKVDPGDLLGLAPRPKMRPALVEFLEQYDEAGQEQLLAALSALAAARR